MNLRSSRSALLALGIVAAATTGLIPVISSAAQTPPQQLPANPNRATPPPNDRGGPPGYDRRGNRFEERLDFVEPRVVTENTVRHGLVV